MFDDVPEPVWKTSIGNWSSWRPSATSSPAAAMRAAMSASSSSSSALTLAAVPLMRPSQWMTGSGTVSPEIWKFSTAFVVSPPHSCCLRSVVLMNPAYALRSGKRADLARHADRVVVGHQEARPGEDPQLRVGQEVERLLGRLDRVVAVLVGPQQQDRHPHPAVGLEQPAVGVGRLGLGEPRPGAREVGVAG